MKIHISEKSNKKIVAILEPISYSEVKEFLDKVGEGEFLELDITFFSDKVLPLEIVEFFSNFKTIYPNKKLKIYTLSHYLFSYLNKLGIENHFIPPKHTNPKIKEKNIQAVVLGGSAESLDKIYTIIEKLPLIDISIFIIQHIKKDSKLLLDKLLAKKTEYTIVVPKDKTFIKTKTIYIAPPNYHLKVKNGLIYLSDEEPFNYAKPSIDILFKSLSDEYKNSLIAVLLCGYGKDGVSYLKSLIENSSTVIVEDPRDCEANVLLKSAIESGYYHVSLSIKNIASYLFTMLVKFEYEFDMQIPILLEEIREKYGYNFSMYNMDSIKRRIKYFMLNESISSIEILREEVLKDMNLFENLLINFSVNVTSFFRDPHVFKLLREEILPYLNSFSHIKIWCAGCSSGEEPYSLAIILHELGMLKKSQIYATDFNQYIIKEAKNGLFPLSKLSSDRENYLNSGGEESLDKYIDKNKKNIKIKEFLKEKILFFEHNLINEGILNEFQLILCRNVLIYFNFTLQNQILKTFHNSLDKSGFLILGKSEKYVNRDNKEYFKLYKESIFKPMLREDFE